MNRHLTGRVPGVKFKLQNLGSRTLKRVEVTIWFKDGRGTTIGEEKFCPVLVTEFGENNPLKPNYIWEMERDKFYPAKTIPSEWKEGHVEARITNIEFEDSEERLPRLVPRVPDRATP